MVYLIMIYYSWIKIRYILHIKNKNSNFFFKFRKDSSCWKPDINLKEEETWCNDNGILSFEVFPNRRIQEKIDRYLSPYNKTFNFRKCMNFDDNDHENKDINNELESPPVNQKWNKISDMILHQNRGFLRKSLKWINKQLYKYWEELSKSYKIRPRRSNCRNQSFYRIQSFKSPSSRRVSSNHLNFENTLKTPGDHQIESSKFIEEEEFNDENISQALLIMKALKDTNRSNSVESKVSSESEQTKIIAEKSVEDFDEFLNQINSYKLKAKLNINYY